MEAGVSCWGETESLWTPLRLVSCASQASFHRSHAGMRLRDLCPLPGGCATHLGCCAGEGAAQEVHHTL